MRGRHSFGHGFDLQDDCLFLFFDVFSMILLFIADNSFKYGTHKRI